MILRLTVFPVRDRVVCVHMEGDRILEADADDFTRWAPILGSWERTAETARYLPPVAADAGHGTEFNVGILLSPIEVTAGVLTTTVNFPADDAEPEPQGRFILGYNARTQAYYSAGLGGWRGLYVVEQFVPREGISPLQVLGRPESLERGHSYDIEVMLLGQNLSLTVDGVEVTQVALPAPAEGSQIGLTAWGRAPVEFSDFRSAGRRRKAFVVMKFGEPYDTLYREVIAPVCEQSGYEPVRADEFSRPGIIIEDIISGIREADVVIAEITPVNANVFYELGYAQARGKPTILLAGRGESLPFDISGQRCIFYDDTIGGKPKVESELRSHLQHLP
jgi:hypothetical protein